MQSQIIRWSSASLLALSLLFVAPMVQAQKPVPSVGGKIKIDKEAMEMLRRMMKAEMSTAYIAHEATIRADGPGGEHIVKHDPKQGTRREGLRPSGMVVLDNFKQLYRFNANGGPVRSNDSFQPRNPGKRLQEMIKRIRSGGLRVALVGQDTVAGRSADIVEVSAANVPGSTTRRFWVDRETGLRLRTEEKDASGKVLSGSYYISLDLSPKFKSDDFTPPPGVKGSDNQRPWAKDRKRFPTVAQAAKAGYSVNEPDYLPSGYTLRQIEVSRNGENISLRYANGLNTLSVMILKIGIPQRINSLMRADGTALVPFPEGRSGFFQKGDGDITYLLISDLPESELRRIAASLK